MVTRFSAEQQEELYVSGIQMFVNGHLNPITGQQRAFEGFFLTGIPLAGV